MYRIGQTGTPSVKRPWALWVLPAAGALIGDYINAGRLRPWLVFPHHQWSTERKGQIGAFFGGALGAAAAYALNME